MTPHREDEYHDDIIYPDTIPFVLVHLACFAAIWTGVRPLDVAVGLGLFLVRMFGVTAGFHRYFSHKSFRTSRVGQFLLAFLCQTSAQKGILWWAAKHREHHLHSDTPLDVHSPKQRGFLFAHLGWIFSKDKGEADYSRVKDLTRFPELVWLNRMANLPAVVLAVAVFATLGWSGLVVGFFWSTVLLYHATFAINSLAHVVGKQRYVTGDDSRNNWWLALITLGEGWHNNHHYYQASTRQGFRWWEVDITYYVLVVLSWTRLVWGLQSPPASVIRGEKPLPRPLVERVARQLAETFPVEGLATKARAGWEQRLAAARVDLEALRTRVRSARSQVGTSLSELHLPELPSLPDLPSLPELPSVEELKARAREMFHAQTASLDDIVARAHELLRQRVAIEILRAEPAPA